MAGKIQGRYIRSTITLEPLDRAVLLSIAKDNGLSGLSSAVRFVLRDWVRRVGWEDGKLRISKES